jgi:hypothetical protein
MGKAKHRKPITENPAILAEWDFENNPGLDPADFTGGSDQEIWWKCELGHRWVTAINCRTRGTKCPYCQNKKAWPGFNDLATLEPRLVDEWDYENNDGTRPEHFTRYSNKIVWWKCGENHSWLMMIQNRTRGRQKCPYCAGRKVWIGFNDLPTVNPRIADEWDYEKNEGLRPERFTRAAHDKVWWKCERGHSWKAAIYSREKHNCPHCHGNALTPGVNDLLTVNPRVASEWDYLMNDGLRPENVAANTAAYAWWLCEKKHSWRAKVSNRNHGSDCPICSNKTVLKGFNDLLFIDPALCEEWDYEKNKELRPDEVVANSGKYAWWKCEHGYRWQARIADRHQGAKCPCSAGKVVIPGKNDLKTLRPDIAGDWNREKNESLTPGQVTVQSTQRVWWSCPKCEQTYEAVVFNRTNGTGCPYCAGHLPIVGKTDLKTVFPNLADEWDHERNKDKKPEDCTCGSNKKVFWKCKCGCRWRATICSRTAGSKCPRCNGKTLMRPYFV